MEITIISGSPEQTRGIGERIGRLLDRSAVLKLTGDLGCGKTALVQGLAKGLDVPPEYYVTSPTFTLVNLVSWKIGAVPRGLVPLGRRR